MENQKQKTAQQLEEESYAAIREEGLRWALGITVFLIILFVMVCLGL